MKLFLQYDIDDDNYFLSQDDDLGAGSIFSSIEGTTTDYTLDFLPEYILRDNNMNLHLFFSVTGSVAITPVILLLTDGDELILSPNDIETKNTFEGDIGVTFNWSLQLSANYPLEDSQIILRLIIEDTRAEEGNASSITLDDSYLEGTIIPGESQTIQAFTTAIFKVFQKTERIFAWTSVEAKEEIEIPLFTNVNNKEQIFLDIYSNVDVKESIEFNLGTTINIIEFNEDEPYVTDIEIDDYILPNWDLGDTQKFLLRKKENLYDLVEQVSVDYDIIVPPDPTVVSFQETALSNTANKIVETFEMLKSQEDTIVPGEVFKIFVPGSLSGGTVSFINGEWQLPIGFTFQEYWVPFSLIPVNEMRPVTSGNSLWFCLRQRIVGSFVNPYYKQRSGKLVLKKKITSKEEIRVWMWDSANAPFDVTLFASNPILQRPGFAGKSAALMLG